MIDFFICLSIAKKSFISSKILFYILPKSGMIRKDDVNIITMTVIDIPVR